MKSTIITGNLKNPPQDELIRVDWTHNTPHPQLCPWLAA